MKKNLPMLLVLLFTQAAAQIPRPDLQVTVHNNSQPGAWHDFTFVHLTDLHIGEAYPGGDYGTPGHDDLPHTGPEGDPALRLRNSVRWLNAKRDSLKLRFVIVTGDLTDSAEESEFLKVKEILDSLAVPYIPLSGNHDVWPYTDTTEASAPIGNHRFNVHFAPLFDTIAQIFPSWDDGMRTLPVYEQEAGDSTFFHNFAFEYRGYYFLFGDFGTRHHADFGEPGVGPDANLFNYPGGTWPWFRNKVAAYPNKGDNNMLFFSHYPPTKDPWAFVNSFSYTEYDSITQFLQAYTPHLGMWVAGHIHRVSTYGVSPWNNSTPVIRGIESAANKDYPNGHLRILNMYTTDTALTTPPPKNTVLPALRIYPQPVYGDAFRVLVTNPGRKALELELRDMQGVAHRRMTLHAGQTGADFRIESAELPAGIYLLRAMGDFGQVCLRFVRVQ